MFGLNEDGSKKDENDQKQDETSAQVPANPYDDDRSSSVSTGAPTAPELTTQEPPKHDDSNAGPSSDNDLLDIKQKALQNLQPLVSHLEQSPEEKFKTTMMLIQATDNSALVKQAYDAASEIPDEKARAQALLDVVNEINYFTHKDSENKL
jgi:hypothetical protein